MASLVRRISRRRASDQYVQPESKRMKTDRLTIGLPYDRRQWHDRDLVKGDTPTAAMLLTSTLTDLAQARLQRRHPPSPALMSYERRGLDSMGSSSDTTNTSVSSVDAPAEDEADLSQLTSLNRAHDQACPSPPLTTSSTCSATDLPEHAGRSLELSCTMYDDTKTQTPALKPRTPRLMPVLSDSSLHYQLNRVCPLTPPECDISSVTTASDMSLRHRNSEVDCSTPLQSTIAYPQNSTLIDPRPSSRFTLKPQLSIRRKVVSKRTRTNSDIVCRLEFAASTCRQLAATPRRYQPAPPPPRYETPATPTPATTAATATSRRRCPSSPTPRYAVDPSSLATRGDVYTRRRDTWSSSKRQHTAHHHQHQVAHHRASQGGPYNKRRQRHAASSSTTAHRRRWTDDHSPLRHSPACRVSRRNPARPRHYSDSDSSLDLSIDVDMDTLHDCTVVDSQACRRVQLVDGEFDLMANYDGCTARKVANRASEDEDVNPEASMIAHRCSNIDMNEVYYHTTAYNTTYTSASHLRHLPRPRLPQQNYQRGIAKSQRSKMGELAQTDLLEEVLEEYYPYHEEELSDCLETDACHAPPTQGTVRRKSTSSRHRARYPSDYSKNWVLESTRKDNVRVVRRCSTSGRRTYSRHITRAESVIECQSPVLCESTRKRYASSPNNYQCTAIPQSSFADSTWIQPDDNRMDTIDSDCTSFNEKPMRPLPVTSNNYRKLGGGCPNSNSGSSSNRVTRRRSIVKRLKSIGRQLRTGTKPKNDLKTLAIV